MRVCIRVWLRRYKGQLRGGERVLQLVLDVLCFGHRLKITYLATRFTSPS